MATAGPHVSIKGETVMNLYGFHITNSLIASLIVTALFAIMAFAYHAESKKQQKSLFFYLIQGVLDALYTLFVSILGNKAKTFFTLLASFFFFIILNNYFGLLPLVNSYYVTPVSYPAAQVSQMEEKKVVTEEHAEPAEKGEKKEAAEEGHSKQVPLLRGATADLNITLALAIISVVLTQVFAFKFIGAAEHLKKYASPIGLLEGFSELSRFLSFSFRLFGNIFAGEVMIAVVSFLLPILTPPFFLLEVFVGFIQAVVFSMLTAVFINMAIQKHH